METSGNELFAQLVAMRNEAGETHYQRIFIANRLLQDRAWVESPAGGGGNEDRALDRLEQECFGDLCGAISLPQLLEIFHNVPNLSDWKKHRFNLSKIWASWKAQQKPKMKKHDRPERQLATRTFTPPLEFEQLTAAKARNEYERAYKAVESTAEKIIRLEQENAELREENGKLKTEIARLKAGVRDILKTA